LKEPNESGSSVQAKRLIKITAINDTLKTTAANYMTRVIAINSYEQEINITLDSAGGGAVPSPGCGKEPPFTGEKRVTVNVSAAGTGNRDYILRLPSDYDKNHPYPLFFAIHCANGSADNVAHSETDTRAQYEYFGLWKFANPTGGKGTTVFCAPEGINAGWGQGAKDLAFFRYMINKFENELCIDMSRIFAMGFSMGGSMSYALACAMPDTMRAIGMLAGGSMSGCDGSHRGPVPIFIAHGTNDPTCRWPQYGYPQIQDLAARCKCDAMDIPALVNQNPPADQMHPVCFEYKNCNPGFPCRACIHKGEHTGSPGTQGSWGKNNTWTDDSAWSYFKRFY
jgi:predicted esterase